MLAEHRADRGDLQRQPLQHLVTGAGVLRDELAGLFGEILQDRAGFPEAQRLSAGTMRIDDRGNLPVRIEREEFRRPALVLSDVHRVRFIRQPHLLKRDRDLHAIRRRKRIELQDVGIFGGPEPGDREGGERGHASLSFLMSRFRPHPEEGAQRPSRRTRATPSFETHCSQCSSG